MISDTLFDAIREIDRYLTDPAFAGAYSEPAIRAEIERVRGEMVALREKLDEVPLDPKRRQVLTGLVAFGPYTLYPHTIHDVWAFYAQMAAEGLVAEDARDGGAHLFTITDAGRKALGLSR